MDAASGESSVVYTSPELFEFDYDTAGVEEGGSDILTELVPNLEQWGDIGWMEVEEYEYNVSGQTMHFILETKWLPPTRWLQQVSADTQYFENKLITMGTIQKDESYVTGVAVMDGELLQNKTLFQLDPADREKYYNDAEVDFDLDELDNQIWDSIAKFVNVCEQFYLEKEEDND